MVRVDKCIREHIVRVPMCKFEQLKKHCRFNIRHPHGREDECDQSSIARYRSAKSRVSIRAGRAVRRRGIVSHHSYTDAARRKRIKVNKMMTAAKLDDAQSEIVKIIVQITNRES